MRLNEIGEFNMIERLRHRFASGRPDVLGIGDDCAVWPLDADRVQMATTDLLIEHIHFLRDRIAPEDLGHKSLAVSLSDIAAMGGTPTAAFISIGLPGDLDETWWDAFFAGVQTLGETWGCPVLGGDTTRSERDIVVNVAVLGVARREGVKYRSGALPGDVLVVTGWLGDAAAGLRLMLDTRGPASPDRDRLIQAHHRPVPRLDEGRWLAGRPGVHAMIDLSDGLDADIRHIMAASGVGAQIDLERLPVSPELHRIGAARRWSVDDIAAAGGEDYALLCTMDASAFADLARAFKQTFQRPLHHVGAITSDRTLTYRRGEKLVDQKAAGFDHFTRDHSSIVDS